MIYILGFPPNLLVPIQGAYEDLNEPIPLLRSVLEPKVLLKEVLLLLLLLNILNINSGPDFGSTRVPLSESNSGPEHFLQELN